MRQKFSHTLVLHDVFTAHLPKIPFKQFWFPDNTPYFQIDVPEDVEDLLIQSRLSTERDILMLLTAINAIESNGVFPYSLFLPYLPGARQDRQINEGEAVTAKVYAELLNGINAECVFTIDPHSHVMPGMLHKCFSMDKFWINPLIKIVKESLQDKKHLVVLAPDVGAVKRIEMFLSDFIKHHKDLHENIHVIQGFKKRNLETGGIENYEIIDDSFVDPSQSTVWILDDICDGGKTFIKAAETLQKLEYDDINLYITHGIFSKGFAELNKYFNRIVTTNSFFDMNDQNWQLLNDNQYHKLTQIKL